MSSGASGPKTFTQSLSNSATKAAETLSSVFSGVTGSPASGSTGGGRRPRNVRGRFLSRRRANRMTFKRRQSRAATVGTKAQVFHGTAKHTSGGLTRNDLMKTKKGRIVSKRKHAAGRVALRRLKAAGYSAKKGTFKLFRK